MSGLILPDGTPASRLLHPEQEVQYGNRLGEETSPYLLQHARNPVAWQPYGEAAFREARERDIPVLISIGYAACHWCHVMERESFEDREVARVMNQNFVCVKVDREERPDVDHLYMTAVQMLTGQGGWPLNVFVDHSGKPFFGGTYFPPRQMYGRPSWLQVCEAITEAWRLQRNDVLSTGIQLAEALRDESVTHVSEQIEAETLLQRAVAVAFESFDEQYGGIGNAPKFPQSMLLEFLLEWSTLRNNDEAGRKVENTLDRMMRGGLFDQLGGGFARYSTDTRWLIPHFEKMLYDNALLSNLYLNAGNAFHRSDFIETAKATLDWALREMWVAGEVGFASSLDADSDGEEGKFYVWTPQEIRTVLGEARGNRFCEIYGVTGEGNFEHNASALWLEHTLAEYALNKSLTQEQVKIELSEDRAKLLEYRDRTRNRPACDDKILTDWNGLMLSSLATGYAVTNERRYLETAIQLAERFANEWSATSKLSHSRRAGKVKPEEYSLDYAAVAIGLLDLYQATAYPKWFSLTIELAEAIHTRFVLPTGAVAQSLTEIAGIRTVDPWDNALPSGNSQAALLWSRVANLTGSPQYNAWSQAAIDAYCSTAMRAPTGFGQLLRAQFRLLTGGEQWIVAGNNEQFHSAIFGKYNPHRELAYATEQPHPALTEVLTGKIEVDGKPTLYRCRNFQCDAPITNPDDL